MISLNKITEASATVDVELDHHCPRCGKVSAAVVRGKASVAEHRSVLEMGSSNAAFLAETEAQRDAALLIRLARCPACSQRDPAAIRRVGMRFVWALVCIAGLEAFLALLGSAPGGDWVAPTIALGVLLLVTWLVLAVQAFRQLRGSSERVRFIEPTARAR